MYTTAALSAGPAVPTDYDVVADADGGIHMALNGLGRRDDGAFPDCSKPPNRHIIQVASNYSAIPY